MIPLEGMVNSFYDRSGSVCLDVINQTWSPMYDMINIFEVFLPQLLRYPNPSDPLNGEAAALLLRDATTYEAKVKGGSLRSGLWTVVRGNADGTCGEQITSRDTRLRMRRTRPAPRAKTTMTSPRWGATTTMTTRRHSRRARWMTYDAAVGVLELGESKSMDHALTFRHRVASFWGVVYGWLWVFLPSFFLHPAFSFNLAYPEGRSGLTEG